MVAGREPEIDRRVDVKAVDRRFGCRTKMRRERRPVGKLHVIIVRPVADVAQRAAAAPEFGARIVERRQRRK